MVRGLVLGTSFTSELRLGSAFLCPDVLPRIFVQSVHHSGLPPIGLVLSVSHSLDSLVGYTCIRNESVSLENIYRGD